MEHFADAASAVPIGIAVSRKSPQALTMLQTSKPPTTVSLPSEAGHECQKAAFAPTRRVFGSN